MSRRMILDVKLANYIGRAIRERRAACDMTQRDVAALAICGPSQIARYELAAQVPNVETLVRIAGALDCSPRDLLPEVWND